MRFVLCLTTLLLLASTAACSHEKTRSLETALEQSVDKFREQLRNEQYHEIYAQSAPELHSRWNETEFTTQLAAAHDYGTSASRAIVIIDRCIWRSLKRTFVNREIVAHQELVSSDKIFANEKFVWAVENSRPQLVSYEFKPICEKPCTIGIGR